MADDFDPSRVTWVFTDEDLAHLCGAIESCEEVVPDLETTGLDEYANGEPHRNGGVPARIVLASLTLPQPGERVPTTWVVPLSHPDSPWLGRWVKTLRQIAMCIREAEKPLINQNIKFDARWIRAHVGVDLSHLIVWDTRVSSGLLDENSSTKLKERAPATFGIDRWDEGFDLSIPGEAERVPMFDLGLYAARDTYWTWRLSVEHRNLLFHGKAQGDQPEDTEEIERARLGRLAVWCSMPSVATLTAVEQRGMLLDRAWTRRERAIHLTEANQIQKRLATRYDGMDPDDVSFHATASWFIEWAAKAVEAGDLVVAELTPTGKPRWSKGILVRQARQGSEVANDLLEWRRHTKKCEYLGSWLDYQTPLGSVHAQYNVGGASTGRLSSSGPNMQQVTATLKPAWVPNPGHVFIDLDYSQIEMRIAAHRARCLPMIAAFARGDDLHRLLAANVTGKPAADITAGERQGAKAGNFGFLFGMSAFGFREYAETNYSVSLTLAEANQMYRTFFDTWEGLEAWHQREIATVQRTGQVISPIGRVRRLPEVWDANEKLASWAERAAINAPVQGMASDMMQVAAASIEGTLPGYDRVRGAEIVATVHDNIVVEAPADRWKEVALACQERMLSVPQVLAKMDCQFEVALAVDIKVGTRWGLSDVAALS